MSLNGKLDPAECFTLKNGSMVPRVVYKTAWPLINELMLTDSAAFIALVEKSRNPVAMVDAGHLNRLQEMMFADEHGNIHRDVADIICSAVTETAQGFAVASPLPNVETI